MPVPLRAAALAALAARLAAQLPIVVLERARRAPVDTDTEALPRLVLTGTDWEADETAEPGLGNLQTEGFDLALTGFDIGEIEALFATATAGLTDPDEVPPVPDVPVTRPSDIWLLGRHRLICGDSTDEAVVGRWFGRTPDLIFVADGEAAATLIPRMHAAIDAYAWRQRGDYRVSPGPNSNTFVAAALDAIPEAHAVLPPTAIGKDYPHDGRWFRRTASVLRFRLTLGGYAAVVVGWVEGIEVSILGAVAGLAVRRPALKLRTTSGGRVPRQISRTRVVTERGATAKND